MKTNYYRQCTLIRRPYKDIQEELVSWIPEQFAVENTVVKLRDRKTGEWIDGWLVKFASEKLPAHVVEDNERNYLRQRSASDVIYSDIKKYNDNICKGF